MAADPTAEAGAAPVAPTAPGPGTVVMPQAETQLHVVQPANPEVSAETARQVLGQSREPTAEELAGEGTPPAQVTYLPQADVETFMAKRFKREAKQLRDEFEALVNPLRNTMEQTQAALDALRQDRGPDPEPEPEPEAVTPPATEPTANRELQKALKRMQDAEAKASQLDAEAKTLRAEKAKAERDTLVARVVAEKGARVPGPFLPLIEGNDEEEIGESIDALVELGRKAFAPKSVGSPAQPPAAAPTAATPLTAEEKLESDEQMINASRDPKSPLHAQAKQWLRERYGKPG